MVPQRVPIHTQKPKPTRADVEPGDTYRNAVEGWLFGDALALMNRRHLDGRLPLDSGNSAHVQTMTEWLNRLARQEFATDDGPNFPVKLRLDLSKVLDSNERRARRALEVWNPTKVEGRRRGGRHGAAQGVTKGRPPRWTHADLRDVWELPQRQRRAAAMALGMSSNRYYQLAPGMPAFLAELHELRQERVRAAAALAPELDALVAADEVTQ